MRTFMPFKRIFAALLLSSAIASAAETLIDVAFTGGPVTGKTGFAATGATSNDFWNTCAVPSGSAALSNLQFVDGASSGAGLTIAYVNGSATNGASDPMYGTYLYNTNITVTLTNLSAGVYNFYIYGHGNQDGENGVYFLIAGTTAYGFESTTNGPGWLSPVWQEGVQYVEFTNVIVFAGRTVTIVEPQGLLAVISGMQVSVVSLVPEAPSVVSQPAGEVVSAGESAPFNVFASGTPPLMYQWLFNGFNIPAATNSGYVIRNVQSANVGSYSVIVSNSYGSVTSSVALLSVIMPTAANLIDVAFTGASVTSKTGFAATGVTSNDFWNTYTANSVTLANLQFIDQADSGAALTVANAGGANSFSSFDPMLGFFINPLTVLVPPPFPNITATVTNLPAGIYDFYVYAPGTIFQLTTPLQSYPSVATSSNANWSSPPWREGVQYAEFTNVVICAGMPVTITVEPAGFGALISGLQMEYVSAPPPQSPFIASPPTAWQTAVGGTANFEVSAGGGLPLACQWLFNTARMAGATNRILTLPNASTTNAGSYSVMVSNAYGSVTSSSTVLTVAVLPPATNLINVAFTGGPPTTERGFAAIGKTANDFWNYCPSYYNDDLPGNAGITTATSSDGILTAVNVSITDLQGGAGSGAFDPMYANYVYNSLAENVTLTITGLPSAAYDFYFYGHGPESYYNSIFQLSVGAQNYGSRETTNGSNWDSPIWQEGVQYVKFTNVLVLAAQQVTVTVEPGYSIYSIINGLQIAPAGLAVPDIAILTQPTNQVVPEGADATYSAFTIGTAPLTYQWKFDGNIIPGATSTNYTVTNAQMADVGSYTIVVSNSFGTVTSGVASLTVTGPPVIAIQPIPQAVPTGSPVTFSVALYGIPPFTYQWLFNGTIIAGATNSSYNLIDAGAANAGIYSVLLSNRFGALDSAPALLHILTPGYPMLIDVAFTSVPVTQKVGFAAVGLSSNDFWNTYDLSTNSLPALDFVDGAASGAGLTVAGAGGAYANGASDLMYGTYLYQYGPDITVVITNLIPGVYDFYLYGHGNNDDENGVFQLSVGTRNYGIEATVVGPGWLSPRWEEGLQYVEFTNVIVTPGQAATITVEPGQAGSEPIDSGIPVLSGLQIVSPPSPIILGQPTGQTGVALANVSFTVESVAPAPLSYQWRFDGADIAAATESEFTVNKVQATNAGSYSVVVSNIYGTATSAVAILDVVAPPTMGMIDVAFTYQAVTGETGFAATGVSAKDYWNTYVVNSAVLPDLTFVDGTISPAGLTVANDFDAYSDSVADLMYRYYVLGQTNIIVTVTNLAPGVYDLYLYGHGGDGNNENGVFQVSSGPHSYGTQATTTNAGWDSPVWQEGVQYVEFTNVAVDAGQNVTITVEPAASYAVLNGLQLSYLGPNPFFVNQPASQALLLGGTVAFSATAIGVGPLAYQWLFNNTNILGATNGGYSITSAEFANAGGYSVILSDRYGSATSSVAVLNVAAPAKTLIDVAFTSFPVTGKLGLAASGVGTNDFWNSYVFNSAALRGLNFVDGSDSGAGLTVSNLIGSYNNGAPDPMYASYVYAPMGGNIVVTITNLAPNVYNFYIYGHGDASAQNGVFEIAGGLPGFGTEATTTNSNWLSPLWQEGVQYVEFTNVIVNAGQTIVVTVEPGASGRAVLCGLQMATITPSAGNPPLVLGAPDQFVTTGQGLIVTNYAFSGNGPVSFALAPGAPEGARITTNGVFGWLPTCEQGSSTNPITVWATDSGSPPLSNSITFSVTVAPCVAVNVGSAVVQAGQNTCLPVSLVSSLGLTNLGFTLAYPGGFLTNWSITANNSLVTTATGQTVDASHALFNVGVQNGRVLQGSNIIGSICLETLPAGSAFVPIVVANMGTAASNNTPITTVVGQSARVVVIGRQPLLEASLGAGSNLLLTLYGNPGANYNLLATTNLFDKSSWSAAGGIALTDLFQVIALGVPTNQMQFFRAVQP